MLVVARPFVTDENIRESPRYTPAIKNHFPKLHQPAAEIVDKIAANVACIVLSHGLLSFDVCGINTLKTIQNRSKLRPAYIRSHSKPPICHSKPFKTPSSIASGMCQK